MADETERWNRVQGESRTRQPFTPKASPVALHTDPERRRNLDQEEAARDRLIFKWVLFVIGLIALLGLMVFLIPRLTGVE